jgi:ribosomal protein L37E
VSERPFFTCPRCGKTSWNTMDVREGYCGHCHDFTGAAHRVEDPFNRDESDRRGLRAHARPIDASAARQLTHLGSESTAVHSRSKGWLPMVALTITHAPMIGDVGDEQRLMLMLGRADVEMLMEHLQGALTGALADAEAGVIED